MGKSVTLATVLAALSSQISMAAPPAYEADYQGAYYGIGIVATRSFSCEQTDAETICELRSKAEAALGTIEETSRFALESDSPIAIEYNYQQSFLFSNRSRTLRFDRTDAVAHYSDRKGDKDIALDRPYFDTLNYQFALGQAAAQGVNLIDLPVLRRGKPADWQFQLVEETNLIVNDQNYQARHYQRVTDDSDKAVDIWLSPELNGLLLKLVYTEDGKSHSLELTDYRPSE